jgi:peptidoglycan/LPS O-acetylase OafA/YrhL
VAKDRSAGQAARPGYRPDIDGLRAVAVVLVILDHLRTRVSGGYIGVDVFFVISGYLISAHILTEMNAGRFSIVNFYERRVRRIFPALLIMLLVCSVLAWLFLLPSELVDFAKSMVAAVLSSSNILFWTQVGYFDAPSALKPLLHTWSLGVEEQFYVFFPLFLIALRRWLPSRLKAALWTAFGVSLLAAGAWVYRDPSAAFFLSPLRAWELLIGTLLSQGYLPRLRTPTARGIGGIAGLLLILVPAVTYTAQTRFPGLSALPPCAGAALVIAAGETGSSWAGRLLSWRPVVFVGLISYSLYLWHWPLIVFWNRGRLLPDAASLDAHAKLGLLAASLVAGTLSWALVERPFRVGRWKPRRKAMFTTAAAVSAALLAVGAWMWATGGLPRRFPPAAQQVLTFRFEGYGEWRVGKCFLTPGATFQPSACLGELPGKLQVVLFGDSLAAQLRPGLVSVFPELNISQATAADCRPFADTTGTDQALYQPACDSLRTYMYGTYFASHRPSAVLLAAAWRPVDMAPLGRSIVWLKGHGQKVIVFGPVPEYDTQLLRAIALALRKSDPEAVLRAHRLPVSREMDGKMAVLARDVWKVEYISAFDDLCGPRIEMVAQAGLQSGDGCPVFAAPGVPLQFDNHHLTVEGSVLYARALRARHQLP